MARAPHDADGLPPPWDDALHSLLAALVLPLRARAAAAHVGGAALRAGRWLLASREHTNYTYHLTELNRRYLAHFLAVVCSRTPEQIHAYLAEILEDAQLRLHVARARARSPRRFLGDAEARYGRRIGWYALVRALRPAVVVEAGVDKGLGACVLAAALLRNRAEGYPGRYWGLDLNARAGYLFQPPYTESGELLFGDAVSCLEHFPREIDLFVSDSNHALDYERREFNAAGRKLSPRAVVVGDNARHSPALADFALATGRRFLYFQEEPAGHWYVGEGLGVAFPQMLVVPDDRCEPPGSGGRPPCDRTSG